VQFFVFLDVLVDLIKLLEIRSVFYNLVKVNISPTEFFGELDCISLENGMSLIFIMLACNHKILIFLDF
jgi:hypothetical protein